MKKPGRPQLIAIVGPNGSGKSSSVAEIFCLEDTGVPFINPDTVEKEAFSHIEDRIERSRAAQLKCSEMRDYFISNRESFGFETVGSHPSKYELLQKARKLGYEIVLVFTSTKCPEINIKRVKKRTAAGGHNISPDPNVERTKIVDRWHRTMYYLDDYISTAHRAFIFDNSYDGVNPKLLLRIEDGEKEVLPAACNVDWINRYYLNRCHSLEKPTF